MRRLRRRDLLLRLGGATAALSILAACEPATSPAPSQAAPAAGGPVGARVTVLQAVDATTLDPSFRGSMPELNISSHLFSMLTWRDPKSLKVVPEIVVDAKLVDDLTWELKLRSGARFHDGTSIDAEAVVFSITRRAKQTLGGKPTLQRAFATLANFETASAVDATTVHLKTTRPAGIVPDLLTSLEALPPSQYADDSAANLARLATAPVGSGPYRLAEWVPGDHLTLEAFDGYWGPRPAFQTVVIKPVADPAARILALQNGQADIIVNVAPDQASMIDASDWGRTSRVPGGRNIFVGFRTDRPLLGDARVRQALNYAFNFDAANRSLLHGLGTRTRTILNPPHEPPDARPYTYDLDKARSLMRDAGWTPGPDGVLQKKGQKFALVMDSPDGRYLQDRPLAQAIQQDLQQLGVQIELRVLDWRVYADMLSRRDPDDIFLLGLGSPFTGQEELSYLHTDTALNATHWHSPEFEQLFDQLRAARDDAKRQDLMNRLWAIAYDDPPWLYVWHPVDVYGASTRIQWDARADERIRMTEATFA